MRMRNAILALTVVLLLFLSVIIVLLLVGEEEGPEAKGTPSTFSVIETGSAGENAYAVYNYRGSGNLTVLSYDKEPKRKIVVINDSQAVDASSLPQLVDELRELEKYGFTLVVTDEPKIGDAIYVLPTGAIPSYALFNLQQNSSNGTIIYFGAKDLLISNGIKQLSWYAGLSPEQRSRIVVYNSTLNEFMEKKNFSLAREILLEGWAAKNRSVMSVSGNGLDTAAARINGSGYLRMVYELDGIKGVFDSPRITTLNQTLRPVPDTLLPNERSTLQFSLNKTNGTAFLSIKKDDKLIEHEQLRRVTDENVFIKRMEYPEPGRYVIVVEDGSGPIASGMLHVRDIRIILSGRQGVTYTFSVMADGIPIENTEAVVYLGQSEDRRKYYITDGQMTLNAKLDPGENTFHFTLEGADIPVVVMNNQDSTLDFYIKYGIPGLIAVSAVYFGARMSRRPTYRLRFGDSANAVRQEMTLPVGRALESFVMIRKDMNLGNNPITAQEFTVSLKRYLTNGADVTEGNVEEILKKLIQAGRLESHRDYYQLRGEGPVKRNVLRRMIKEKLIESGMMFNESGDKFVTKDFEVGFFGDRFNKKALIVVDDKAEMNAILAGLDKSELARIRLMQANDKLQFVEIDRLGDIL